MRVKAPTPKARAATAALVPALLLVAGCGGPGAPAPGAGPEGSATASAAAGAPTAPAAPRTGTALERAALVQGDLDGYQISAQGKNPRAPDGQPQADRHACQPLADIMGDKPDPAARETVDRGIGSRKQVGLAVSATLSSYAVSDAQALIARLRGAVAACGTGFSATIGEQTGSYRDVRATEYRTGGDESVSWTTTVSSRGVSAHAHLLVIRAGSAVVRLMALDVTAAGRKAEVPHEVTDKQLQKIRSTG